MCCFSRNVVSVSDTIIFARKSKENRQYLVYSMRMHAKEDLAMILPIPVPTGSPEDAVKFINLEKYPNFFLDMDNAFPKPKSLGNKSRGAVSAPREKLEVVEVGSFVASFVPSVADFDRLDEQFRLPSGVWDKLPTYKDYGFAVFKLKPGNRKIHPMAFEFPRRDPEKLFFPTVHIHDGLVHPRARFHHTLFCQRSGNEALMDWQESPGIARPVMKKPDELQGLVDLDDHLYKKTLTGMLENRDTLV